MLTRWFTLFSLTLLFAGVAEAQSENSAGDSVVHVVLCWLKEPGNAADRQTVIETSLALEEIPQVVSISAGEPIASERPIVDDSFDVAIIVRFASTDDMQIYQDHPMHVKAVNDVLNPLVDKLVIYDYME